MQIGNIAARLIKPFAKSGSKATIPLNQTDATRASYDQGFPPLNMTPIAAGGVPPSGQDMNGILYSLSNAVQWQQAMGILPWDSGFASDGDVAGYPNGAIVTRNGVQYISTKDSNTDEPGVGSGWVERYLQKSYLELNTVPSQKIAPIICVTQPHLRMMVWNGTQYVRAPWHQPCQLFFSYDNPASISGALPVRGDVSYQQSNYPDVVGRLGLSGVGTFTLVEARGEFLRVLDNGRGVDAGRVKGTAQTAYAGSNTITVLPYGMAANPGGVMITDVIIVNGIAIGQEEAETKTVDVTPGDSRPRNIAFPLWMTI